MNRDVEDPCFDESDEYEFDEDDLRRIEAWEKIVKCTRRAHIGSLVMLAASLVSLVVQIINLLASLQCHQGDEWNGKCFRAE